MSSLNDSTDQNDSIPLEESYSDSYYDYSGTYTSDRNFGEEGSSIMNDSVDASQPTGSKSRGRESSANDPSADYSDSMYYNESTSYYSSGYETGSYYDNSPRSGSMTSMGSTWATFYSENKLIRSVGSFLSRYKRPLTFLTFSTVGSGILEGWARTVQTYTQEAKVDNVLQFGESHLPSGYPQVPMWLSEARASLPWVMEKSAKATLSLFGVPSAADVVVSTKADSLPNSSDRQWQFSGKLIPPAFLLPAFTFLVLNVYKSASKRNNSSLFDTRHSGATSVMSPTNRDSRSMNESTLRTTNDGTSSGPVPSRTVNGSSVDASNALTKDTVPHSLSPPESMNDPSSAMLVDEKVNKSNESYGELDESVVMQYAFDGDVVCGLVGEPTITEVNALLIACIKYGCGTVILPESVSTVTGLVKVPPSIDLEFVGNVSSRAGEIALRRNLFVTVVTPVATGENAKSLREYVHPSNVVYLLFSGQCDASVVQSVASRSQNQIYSETAADPTLSVLVNECFYDRLLKERAQE
ncbi:hypothetical protein AGDE_00289 [Angomonas deanei]|uniref:Uncharacterized protein n=1 Tax=Angomonas deanei TaxID=59799 RepID=A0A7G2C806_9TRYP|nr:hypothetical protein AGDE_00289 [Angomonas deanei]CAD2215876.1 hypothetical protein, conserved [Angomonas deanei]|eukprot:EPY43632.1 hypothetical protein AGDE_00289 [Angomonas deanei]